MTNKKEKRLLPFSVIESAAGGDAEAISAVLKHYERYINTLATRDLYDESGVSHRYLDEELKRTIEIRLITQILKFEMIRPV